MQLLLDTNVVIALLEGRVDSLPRPLRNAVRTIEATRATSVASLWEIAIKSRLGKLPLRAPLLEIPGALGEAGVDILTIQDKHVLAPIDPEPNTRDPFDRLLLAQCHVENLRLVTLDRALAAHPLAWRPE